MGNVVIWRGMEVAMTASKLFGTDGVRGKANSKEMNTEVAVAIGRAAAYSILKDGELPQIVIGKDTRLSGYMIEEALTSGITSMGINVIKTGPLPTPGVAFICRSMRSRLGIVISASHNPASENGIKLFAHDGFKLNAEQEEEIERLIFDKVPEKHLAEPNKIGKVTQIHDAAGRYIQYLKETFPHEFNLKGLKIALDAANGAAYSVAPSVFEEMGAEVVATGTEPSGLNINDNCGALYPRNVCTLTKKVGANIGVSLDGDADRLMLSDENGNIVDGDGILYVCAKHLHAKGNLGKSTIVGTIMTNFGLDAALKKEGIAVVRSDVGDQKVIEYMRGSGINLGGESCGHLIYLHHSSTGDGTLAALRIMSIMKQTGKKLSELVKDYRPFPQKTINVRVKDKTDFNKINEIAETRVDIERQLKDIGRVVLRYSGTEALARVTVESNDERLTDALCTKLAETVKKHLGV